MVVQTRQHHQQNRAVVVGQDCVVAEVRLDVLIGGQWDAVYPSLFETAAGGFEPFVFVVLDLLSLFTNNGLAEQVRRAFPRWRRRENMPRRPPPGRR